MFYKLEDENLRVILKSPIGEATFVCSIIVFADDAYFDAINKECVEKMKNTMSTCLKSQGNRRKDLVS